MKAGTWLLSAFPIRMQVVQELCLGHAAPQAPKGVPGTWKMHKEWMKVRVLEARVRGVEWAAPGVSTRSTVTLEQAPSEFQSCLYPLLIRGLW